MFPIKINTNELVQEFSLTNKDIEDLKQEILSGICNELYRQWQNQARNNLKSTRSEYIRSLKVFREGKFLGGVQLLGKLPNMLESGTDPFDIKIGELKSSKTKKGAKGQDYITIPFRFGVPTTIGESTIFTDIMPQAVYNVAKALQKKQQIQKTSLPSELQIPKSRGLIKAETQIFQSYVHKSSIYQGIQKSQGGKHTHYTSFRRVSSTGSDENSWIHKGFLARKLGDKALDSMEVVLVTDKTIDNFLNQKFG